MEDAIQQLLDSAVIDEEALEKCIQKAQVCSSTVVRELDMYRMKVLNSRSDDFLYQQEKELQRWAQIGQRYEGHLSRFICFLQSKSTASSFSESSVEDSNLGSKNITLSISLKPSALQRYLILLQQCKTKLTTARVQATASFDSRKRISRLGSEGSTSGVDREAVNRLLRVRASLFQEVQKVERALIDMKKDAESIEKLQDILQDTTGALETAKKFTKKLISVDSIDSILLHLSFVIFLFVVGYVWLHRFCGFFPLKT